MKIFLIAQILALAFRAYATHLLYPQGGEEFNYGTQANIIFSNDVPLKVTVFLDFYGEDGNGTPVSHFVGSDGDFRVGMGQIPISVDVLPAGLYKAHLVGEAPDGNWYHDESDFVRVTGALLGLTLKTGTVWAKNQALDVELYWQGQQINETYKLNLRPVDQFIPTNVLTLADGRFEDATATESLSFMCPTNIYNGIYVLEFVNEHGVTVWSADIDVSPTDVRISVAREPDGDELFTTDGDKVPALRVVIDARRVTKDVRYRKLPLLVWASLPEISLKPSLVLAGKSLSLKSTPKVTGLNSEMDWTRVSLELKKPLTVRKGTVIVLTVRCAVKAGDRGKFMWVYDRFGEPTVTLNYVDGTTLTAGFSGNPQGPAFRIEAEED